MIPRQRSKKKDDSPQVGVDLVVLKSVLENPKNLFSELYYKAFARLQVCIIAWLIFGLRKLVPKRESYVVL